MGIEALKMLDCVNLAQGRVYKIHGHVTPANVTLC